MDYPESSNGLLSCDPHIFNHINQKRALQRFWANTTKSEGCWEWGARKVQGYGRFKVGGVSVSAHRFSYIMKFGIEHDTALSIDHLCRNRGCVNPEHMEMVTTRENLLRGDTFNARNVKKIWCMRGHPLYGHNLYITPVGNRCCRTCSNAGSRMRRRARRLRSQILFHTSPFPSRRK